MNRICSDENIKWYYMRVVNSTALSELVSSCRILSEFEGPFIIWAPSYWNIIISLSRVQTITRPNKLGNLHIYVGFVLGPRNPILMDIFPRR